MKPFNPLARSIRSLVDADAAENLRVETLNFARREIDERLGSTVLGEWAAFIDSQTEYRQTFAAAAKIGARTLQLGTPFDTDSGRRYQVAQVDLGINDQEGPTGIQGLVAARLEFGPPSGTVTAPQDAEAVERAEQVYKSFATRHDHKFTKQQLDMLDMLEEEPDQSLTAIRLMVSPVGMNNKLLDTNYANLYTPAAAFVGRTCAEGGSLITDRHGNDIQLGAEKAIDTGTVTARLRIRGDSTLGSDGEQLIPEFVVNGSLSDICKEILNSMGLSKPNLHAVWERDLTNVGFMTQLLQGSSLMRDKA